MEIDKMNWRDVARKPFELVGMDAPRETVRVLRHRLFGAPYVWTDFPPVIQISTNNYCGPEVCGVLCEYCFPQWNIARGKDYPGELSMEVLEWCVLRIWMVSALLCRLIMRLCIVWCIVVSLVLLRRLCGRWTMSLRI